MSIDADWLASNQRALVSAVEEVRGMLVRHVERVTGRPVPSELVGRSAGAAAESPLPDAPSTVHDRPALDRLCATFKLSSFERAVLVLCAAVELDARFAALCAMSQGVSQSDGPTFGLALAALPDAHWSALAPGAPLRRWQLLTLGSGRGLTMAPLRIDERVLHFLAGIPGRDERLAGIFEPITTEARLLPSQEQIVEQIVSVWTGSAAQGPVPIVQLCGDAGGDFPVIAAAACRRVGLSPWSLVVDALPTQVSDIDPLIRCWGREAALTECALLVDFSASNSDAHGRPSLVGRVLERCRGIVLVATHERHDVGTRPTMVIPVSKPVPAEQRLAWREALREGAERLNGHLDDLVSHFALSGQGIRSAALDATGRLSSQPDLGADIALWDACRIQARPRMDDLAQRIESDTTWDALVLPDAQRQVLREMAAHVRHRATVYERWGFAGRGNRGLGTSALFAGASGTGKTMAAEVLANELRLDLYRIDLSAVVSKYIGETEKNLRSIFDAAEEGGVILLFDEADALFGKRSEVKDSHDRYANIEISYLLQRMESYRGLAVLTTNLKGALDTAFLRRLRFVVQFPFPDEAQRAAIWSRVFPSAAPLDSLDVDRLAQLTVAGGNIQSIALNAAFLAADLREPVRMSHVLHAAHREYAKLERPLTEAETAGWADAR
jgi:hypothetical protein